jgi:hypothetical protein
VGAVGLVCVVILSLSILQTFGFPQGVDKPVYKPVDNLTKSAITHGYTALSPVPILSLLMGVVMRSEQISLRKLL